MPQPPASSDYQLYQRAGSTNWYVRFSVKGHGQIRKSLETDDREIAEKNAYKVWFEAEHRAKLGLDVKERSFRSVAEQYIDHLAKLVEHGEKPKHVINLDGPTIRRYFIGFFGDKPIDAIGLKDITRYYEWRKTYWTTGPGSKIDTITYERAGRIVSRPVATIRQPATPSRLKRESVLLRQVFNQAFKWGYVSGNHVPLIEPIKAPDNPRPSFSAEEFKALKKLAFSRTAEKGISSHIRHERFMLFAYINLAGYSGMRPTELKNLNWGDIHNYTPPDYDFVPQEDHTEVGQTNVEMRPKQELSISVRGKGLARTFIPHPHTTFSFDLLGRTWKEWIKRPPEKDDPVFFTPSGKRLVSLNKSLNNLLKLAGLEKDHRGVKRTAYSFRHFYISQMLVNNVDVFLVSQNTGTSPDMVRRFYADVNIHKQADVLRGKWEKGT